jgi:short subunit dehydrogenase-like uncharacterized protein
MASSRNWLRVTPGPRRFYAAMPRALRLVGYVEGLLATRPVRALLRRLVERGQPGPSDAQRARAKTVLWGEVRDAQGHVARALLTVPEGYTLTGMTALDIAQRILAGEVEPGYRTPAMVDGPDYILGFEGVTREDLPAA